MPGRDERFDWRASVLDSLLWWSVRLGAPLSVLLVVIAASRQPAHLSDPRFVAMVLSYAGTVVLQCSRAPYRVRAAAYCVLLVAISASAVSLYGVVPGPLLMFAVAVVSAGLLLGRRAALATLIVTAAVVLVAGWLVPSPLIPVDGSWIIALRGACAYAALTTVLAVLVGHVVGKIERSLEQSEEALAKYHEAEQRRHHTERALDQTQQALLRSQKLEAVGRLAAGVGHDFNNSLQVILSWASLLRDERDPEQIGEGLGAIERAARQGSELTARLLSFGRKGARAPRTTRPDRLLEEAATSMRRLLPEDIRVSREVGEADEIFVDPAQLAHVLLNLGINARDAMSSGGVLTLGVESIASRDLPAVVPSPEPSSPFASQRDGDGVPTSAAGDWVHLWVKDTGTGMSEETRSHVFEPFFSTKGEQGTGLGLATAYAIVRQNGGVIHCESEVGQGSCFHVYFPVHGSGESEQAVASSGSGLVRDGTILVAEDEADVRTSVVRALEATGFRVIAAHDAASAMDALDRAGRHVDLLCTDGIMPGGGTQGLIDHYLSLHPGGQVLLCSGYLEEELLRRKVDAGTYAFLPKPFAPAQLVERVGELLVAATAPDRVAGNRAQSS